MVTELVLVRHGQTDSNVAGVLSGWEEVALTDEGRRQAASLRATLPDPPYASVVSSDLSRAVDTARRAGFEPMLDDRWRELDFGDIEGQTFESCSPWVQAALTEFDGFVAPGGEATAELVARVSGAIAEFGPGRHLVFTHGGPIRVVLRRAGAPDHRVATGEWIAVRVDDGGTLSLAE